MIENFIKSMILSDFNFEEGIFCIGDESVKTKFEEETQDLLFKIEDGSWWFQFRAALVEKVAEKYMNNKTILVDVGGGNGYTTLFFMKKGWNIALIEPSWKGCVNAKIRGIKTVICGTVSGENIRNQYVPQIMLLDVLEHIENDELFLKLLYEKLVSGGKLIITVPALERLWSSEDDASGHFRRYDKRSLEELAIRVGFSIVYSNYFFEFLVIPIWMVRHIGEKIGFIKCYNERNEKEKRRIINSEFKQKNGIIRFLLNWFEKQEMSNILSEKAIKRGSSIVCVLEKV